MRSHLLEIQVRLMNNLSKEKHLALKDLIKNRDFVIQKADKCNTVVILNKNDYISEMKVILINSSIHYPLTDVLKKLKNKKIISEKKYEDFYPLGSSPGILYGRAKIHKAVKIDVPPFRHI